MARRRYKDILTVQSLADFRNRSRQATNVEGNPIGTPLSDQTIHNARVKAGLGPAGQRVAANDLRTPEQRVAEGQSPITQEEYDRRRNAQAKSARVTSDEMKHSDAVLARERGDIIRDLRKQGKTQLADQAASESRQALMAAERGEGSTLNQLAGPAEARAAAAGGYLSLDDYRAAQTAKLESRAAAEQAHQRAVELAGEPNRVRAEAEAAESQREREFKANQSREARTFEDAQRKASEAAALHRQTLDHAFRANLSDAERKDRFDQLKYERESMLKLANQKAKMSESEQQGLELKKAADQMKALDGLITGMSENFALLSPEDQTFLKAAQARFAHLADMQLPGSNDPIGIR